MQDGKEDEGRLSSEELEKDEWRDRENIVQDEGATGHTAPASESGVSGGAEGGQHGPSPTAGTMLPPD